MTDSIISSPLSRQALGPEDLRRAAEAFEMALQALDEQACAMNPYTARRILARLIIERALKGEQEPALMCTGALEELRQMHAQGSLAV